MPGTHSGGTIGLLMVYRVVGLRHLVHASTATHIEKPLEGDTMSMDQRYPEGATTILVLGILGLVICAPLGIAA